VIVLDANVLIALLDRDDVHHELADSLFRAHLDEPKAVSVLTMAEFLVRPTKHGTAEAAIQDAAAIEVEVLPLPAGDAAALAETRARSGLKMPDAIVLHTAQRTHASVMTFDQDLARAAHLMGLTTLGQS